MANRNSNQRRDRRSGDQELRRRKLGQFVEPLTGKAYRQERRAAEREQFQPQARQLQGETRAEKEFRKRARDYFDNYEEAVQAAQQSTTSAYSDALNKATAQSQQAQATDTALRAELEAAARQDAQLRGATYTPSATSTQAASNRSDSAALMAGKIAAQGATQAAYLSDKQRIGEGEAANQLLRSQARSRSLNSDKRDLAKMRSAFRKDYRARARETERAFYLENQSLADAQAGRDAQMDLARLYGRNERRSQQRSLDNQLTVTAAQDANERADDRRSSDLIAQGQRGSRDRNRSSYSIRDAVAFIREAERDRNFTSRQQAIDYLLNRGVSRSVAQKAIARLLSGGGGGTGPTPFGGQRTD